VPGTDVFEAIMVTAQRLASGRIVCGRSNKLTADEQGKLTGDAWERLPEPRPRLTLMVYEPDGTFHEYLLGPHTPRMRPQDIGLMHNVWLDITKDPRFAGAHHYHVVALALEQLQQELKGSERRTATGWNEITRTKTELNSRHRRTHPAPILPSKTSLRSAMSLRHRSPPVTRVTDPPPVFCHPAYRREHVQATSCERADACAERCWSACANGQRSASSGRDSRNPSLQRKCPRHCSQVPPLEFLTKLQNDRSPAAREYALRQRTLLLFAPRPCEGR
jgi:hypothetical protein